MSPAEIAILIAILLAGAAAVGAAFFVVKTLKQVKSSPAVVPGPGVPLADTEAVRAAEAKAKDILSEAKREAERIAREGEFRAKDEANKRREEIAREMEKSRAEIRETERRIEKREDALEQQLKELTRKDRQTEHLQKQLTERKEDLERKSREFDGLIAEETKKLLQITGLTRETAEKLLLDRLERELTNEVANRVRKAEESVKIQSEEKAREIIATAIYRYASPAAAEATTSAVEVPSDDVKGRIIGREGRNIRTFEKATGVDVIVDDTPGLVIISAFDQVRREIARLSLVKLIADGRIHPARIEEIVVESQQEMERHLLELGRQAVDDANVPMPSEKILHLLGRLRFRTSYSQNVLRHSVEVAHLCGMMASELGLNAQLARRCGLLHDIGKAADHEMEGGHPKIGADLAKRYGETSKEVLHAIAGHHDDVTVDNIYTVLVASADAISASRPGARRESLEKYIKRLEQLEAVACGFPEVENAYAIQAGREVRVIVRSDKATDADAIRVCREIARSIEQQLDYPGEIKVTVIRETRAFDVAK
ncbi:MAG: ribonuclease Y [Gemmataceae bacterium]